MPSLLMMTNSGSLFGSECSKVMSTELSLNDEKKMQRASDLLQHLVDIVFSDDEKRSKFSAIGPVDENLKNKRRNPSRRKRSSRRGSKKGRRRRSRS